MSVVRDRELARRVEENRVVARHVLRVDLRAVLGRVDLHAPFRAGEQGALRMCESVGRLASNGRVRESGGVGEEEDAGEIGLRLLSGGAQAREGEGG